MSYRYIVMCLALASVATVCAAPPTTIALWPGRAPGGQALQPQEADVSRPGDKGVAGKSVQIRGNVSDPTITIYRPDPAKDTGAAVLVCPGGGYYILALDLEGTEACEWLNSIGVTAVLLKYRVPRREGIAPYAAPLQDAQRALGIVRSRAKEFGIDPTRIGVLGFSAGGDLAAILCNNHRARTYPAVDAADAISCRPDFCILIYPAYLTVKEKDNALAPELVVSREGTPPTFLTMTEDDPERVENALVYYLALKNASVPAEMHLYPRGGHGYGLRRTELNVTTWPDRAADWMQAEGFLKTAK
jgi:acetyl esterase/lipase